LDDVFLTELGIPKGLALKDAKLSWADVEKVVE
jgi:hypothetical protein